MTLDLDDLARDVLADPPTRIPGIDALRDRVRRRRRTRRVITGVAATPLVALAAIGAWSVLDRNDRPDQVITADIADPDIADSPDNDTSSAATEWAGPYVWPAPPRSFDNVDELVDRFVDDVLGWDPGRARVDVASDDGAGQTLDLVDLETGRTLQLVVVRSVDGWGLQQIGDGRLATGDRTGAVGFISFLPPADSVMNTVVIRYGDGTTSRHTVASSTSISPSTSWVEVRLPETQRSWSEMAILVIHSDESGATISASGWTVGGAADPTTNPSSRSGSDTSNAVVVPNFTSMLREDARGILESLGLEARFVETVAPDVAPGTVLSSEPGPGLTVPVGTTISLTVAAPPES